MSERTKNTLFLVAAGLMIGLLVILVAGDPTEADRVEQLGSRIKCPVCQGESILDSPADMARDMMAVVEERVASGVSDEAIVDELLAGYSGAVLLDPPASGSTLALWLAPLVALGVGFGVIVFWRRHPVDATPVDRPPTPGARRRLSGAIVLGLLFVGTLVVAVLLIRDDEGPNAGVANIVDQDLSAVSNETLEAVVSANSDNPQIDGMRLALAERYYEIGDYRAAFPHYLLVAESTQASPEEATTALIRLGWMAWEGNGEVEAALGLFDEALSVQPSSTTALFLKGQVLWCGVGDLEGAAELFAAVLEADSLTSESKQLVETSLTSVSNGERCR